MVGSCYRDGEFRPDFSGKAGCTGFLAVLRNNLHIYRHKHNERKEEEESRRGGEEKGESGVGEEHRVGVGG